MKRQALLHHLSMKRSTQQIASLDHPLRSLQVPKLPRTETQSSQISLQIPCRHPRLKHWHLWMQSAHQMIHNVKVLDLWQCITRLLVLSKQVSNHLLPASRPKTPTLTPPQGKVGPKVQTPTKPSQTKAGRCEESLTHKRGATIHQGIQVLQRQGIFQADSEETSDHGSEDSRSRQNDACQSQRSKQDG